MSGINPIQLPSLTSIEGLKNDTPVSKGTDIGGSFANMLTEARDGEKKTAEMSEKFANGDTSVGIHEVMIQGEKSGIAIRYATTLKNKAIEAYRELMNTQV